MNGEEDRERLYYSARAKIFWGESAESVREMLMQEGMEWLEVNRVVKEMQSEREEEIREKGRGGILVGTGMVFGAVLLGAVAFLGNVIPLKLIGVLGLVAVYGLYRLVKGQRYLFSAGQVTGSLQDL